MNGVRAWLRHAFAVDATPAEPSLEQIEVVERLCREVVRRELTTPAVAFLEMSRPLNFLGSQALHFFSPMISAVARGQDHDHLAAFLERRDAIDRIIAAMEAAEKERADSDTP